MAIAFEQAAVGLIAQMIETAHARAIGEARVEVEAESLDRLLFRFLEEIHYLFETRRWVIVAAHVELVGESKLRARLEGEAYDPARHGHVHEIKAITFHELHVQRDPPDVRVIVDI